MVIPLILLATLAITPITIIENVFAKYERHTDGGNLIQAASISNSCLNPISNSNTNDNMISNGNCGGTVLQQGKSAQASSPTTMQSANPNIEVQRSTTTAQTPSLQQTVNCSEVTGTLWSIVFQQVAPPLENTPLPPIVICLPIQLLNTYQWVHLLNPNGSPYGNGGAIVFPNTEQIPNSCFEQDAFPAKVLSGHAFGNGGSAVVPGSFVCYATRPPSPDPCQGVPNYIWSATLQQRIELPHIPVATAGSVLCLTLPEYNIPLVATVIPGPGPSEAPPVLDVTITPSDSAGNCAAPKFRALETSGSQFPPEAGLAPIVCLNVTGSTP